MHYGFEDLLVELDKLICLAEENKKSIEKKKNLISKIQLKIFVLGIGSYCFALYSIIILIKLTGSESHLYKLLIIFGSSSIIMIAMLLIIKLLNSYKESKNELKIDNSMQARVISIIDEQNSRITHYNSISPPGKRISFTDLLVIEARLMRLGLDI